MNILAIETTERIGSVAAMSEGQLLCELGLDPSQRSAQSLAPAVKSLLSEVDWQPGNIDLVAVTVGPGSFTGLRVGIATAKTLAFCCEAEILGINTLEAIAAAAPSDVDQLEVVVDAQRNEVVVQKFRRGEDGWFTPEQDPARLVDIDDWLEGLAPGTVISGPILKRLANRLPQTVIPLPPEQSHPTAANIARLAARHHAAGRRDDVWKLVPVYSRQSAAEEKWAERQAKNSE
ncbi:MAG: tRNA (adenosine(37)-N6)-threonylcarbamoyltransferase complex dimerization subunit type 1 TsaB [Pirellulales bacterium]|nr:tRNA (adenosine(37)-N6)-threonylcarbamoyltransferase complex dimerization subunit type 1 TsaB [Pirellulales bacterium]